MAPEARNLSHLLTRILCGKSESVQSYVNRAKFEVAKTDLFQLVRTRHFQRGITVTMASHFRTPEHKSTTKSRMSTGSATATTTTTTTPKKLRRRIDGSPAVPRMDDHLLPPKTIYLIRHGQSLGQAAKALGWDRKTDKLLIDCGLTELGISQAYGIRKLFSAKKNCPPSNW